MSVPGGNIDFDFYEIMKLKYEKYHHISTRQKINKSPKLSKSPKISKNI